MKSKKANTTHVKTDLERTLYKALKKDMLKTLVDFACEHKFKWNVNADDNELTINIEIDCKGAELL